MSDLIDRQAAMDALARIFDQCEEIEAHLPKGDPDITGYKMYPDYMIVWEYLHQLPSAEPKRKQGHWIVRNEYSMWPVLCSECRGWQSGRSRFCPDCGADMRGEQEPR